MEGKGANLSELVRGAIRAAYGSKQSFDAAADVRRARASRTSSDKLTKRSGDDDARFGSCSCVDSPLHDMKSVKRN